MIKDKPIRSIVKGVSWRIFASIDTFFLSWFIFDNPHVAGGIATLEIVTKILLYFLHERLWNQVTFGRKENGEILHIRSIAKGISWRFIGTLDTMILSWILTGAIKGAISLGFMEIFTKIGLFYIHERIWVHVKWGRKQIQLQKVSNY